MTDHHLTYRGSVARPASVPRGSTVYDVYPRDGGPQLGWVVRQPKGGWTAISCDPAALRAYGRTRRAAATDMWGTSDD